jgi:hypothetical protein
LKIDVQAVRRRFYWQNDQNTLGPADQVQFIDDRASSGMVIQHPEFKRALTTAAHLFPSGTSAGAKVIVKSRDQVFETKLSRAMFSSSLDYALLEVNDGDPSDNLFRDTIRLGPVYVPTIPEDIDRQVFVLAPNGKVIQTRCRGINARITLPSGRLLTNLILTDAVTSGGQSGTSLIDSKRRIWGLLRGALYNKYSAFMPAHLVLSQENATLV